MAKKKTSMTTTFVATSNDSTSAASSSSLSASSSKSERKKRANKTPGVPTSSLAISRNKHWRYISAFHGPWLQLPLEILETLAHSNYLSPRPQQTDPAVLYDLLKIRRLVDDASDLAVRAQNGTASSALTNGDNGLPGSSLGLSYRGIGCSAKLSPERKYRMRELATQKLAQAYRLDEIAASVATMQGASTLDNVASLVLQRSPGNTDAKYVHFFHEKIPSRMISGCTSLLPLNDIITRAPGHAAPFRTRALTKIFKDDHLGAIQDLTDGLAICRLEQAKRRSTRNQLVPLKLAKEEAEKRKLWTRDWMQENKVADVDQPSGMEMQLLFQRGNQYLTVACQHIRTALDHFRLASMEQRKSNGVLDAQVENKASPAASDQSSTYKRGLEARETVRKNAKKALRDYTAFFSQLDYAHAPVPGLNEALFSGDSVSDEREDNASQYRGILSNCRNSKAGQSSALVRQCVNGQHQEYSRNFFPGQRSSPPPELVVHDISALLSASPPASLPPFPPSESTQLVNQPPRTYQSYRRPADEEMITYHPLMPEALHSLLLTHCLLQTPPTALLRHAYNVARLARLADGYPFFVSARSPARADWAEILRKTNNWIGLSDAWESLCKPPSPPDGAHEILGQTEEQDSLATKDSKKHGVADISTSSPRSEPESSEQKRDRIHKEAVMEALGDERVTDDNTFQRAVEARERRAWRDESCDEAQSSATPDTLKTNVRRAAEPIGSSNCISVLKDEEYLIGTERAEALAKWVLEAPTVVEGKPKRSKKKASKRTNHRLVEQAESAVLQNDANELQV